ncbi:hyaluronate lyase [Marmoricola endophyticus]|uniref:Hyaluronate lyase n=1 Tax=Marmoricola endophyticus TaxID=2040280 RepID=A0A917BE41_9ACTN|nr:geranylgeranyl reductase family protein [Marmoricola endophyticus]GGF37164.1 hyaluronate lyase [Marmoricola endophyticus]
MYDVVVVGAGPAGSCAAVAAAERGADVLLLDRASFPRYKTCGGGLIGVTLAALPHGFVPPVRTRVDTATLTRLGRTERTRTDPRGVVQLVARSELDAALVEHAVGRGVEFRHRVLVTGVEEDADGVTLTTSDGPVRARTVVAADGSTSRLSRYVGATFGQADLGLEDELVAPDPTAWAHRIHLDWGPVPGSYAWVFPKGELLTVGVITPRGDPATTKEYLAAYKRSLGLADAHVVHHSGHLTRCREPGSPVGRGRVLLAGDAAGLLEPWTREGISFAVRSGTWAGTLAGEPDAAASYTALVEAELGAEMAAGAQCLAALSSAPALLHRLLTGPAWGQFTRLTRGETTLARAVRRRPVRLALAALDAQARRSPTA